MRLLGERVKGLAKRDFDLAVQAVRARELLSEEHFRGLMVVFDSYPELLAEMAGDPRALQIAEQLLAAEMERVKRACRDRRLGKLGVQ